MLACQGTPVGNLSLALAGVPGANRAGIWQKLGGMVA